MKCIVCNKEILNKRSHLWGVLTNEENKENITVRICKKCKDKIFKDLNL